MGWTRIYQSKKQTIADLTSGREFGEGYKVLRHALRGEALYMVVEAPSREADAQPKRFIAVCLVNGGKNESGYKDMDETMGPCVVSCPLAFLDMVPDPGGYATEWRARVRAYHAQRAALKVGARVTFRDGVTWAGIKLSGIGAEITSARPLRVRIDGYTGSVRVTARCLKVGA